MWHLFTYYELFWGRHLFLADVTAVCYVMAFITFMKVIKKTLKSTWQCKGIAY